MRKTTYCYMQAFEGKIQLNHTRIVIDDEAEDRYFVVVKDKDIFHATPYKTLMDAENEFKNAIQQHLDRLVDAL